MIRTVTTHTEIRYDVKAPKKATNLSINADLLRKSRDLGINLSSTLEKALREVLRTKLRERWLAENQVAMASYNEYVDEHGVFSDGFRSF